MHPRPTTGNQRKANLTTTNQPLQGKLRPHSAALFTSDSPSHNTPASSSSGANGERVGATSDELIRDLEHKVRKVVELKRAQSDKLRFAVTKKREEVEKAKLILQDLIKDSEALGLHYNPSSNQVEEGSARGHLGKSGGVGDGNDDKIVEEPNRLQPIASISRRPVYSKHTKINELETKLERRAQACHEVMRSTMVLEHIKRRLLSERSDITQETNQLKTCFADLNHQTQELQKKEITASEAVSQVQTRLAQQKEDMATNLRKYKREVEMRQKWAREKAKFEKYYNDQMQTLLDAHNGQNASAGSPVATVGGKMGSPMGHRGPRPGGGSPSRPRKDNNDSLSESSESQEEYRQAFLRMGFSHHAEGVDPEEIIRVFISHEEIMKELDAKHDEDMERVTLLRDQLAKSRNIATEKIPLSKRGTSQRLETKEIEISSVERALATVVDQYMFVDQSVRPLKIGLQQILQNVTNETVNVDDMAAVEKTLMASIEEMMKLVRENRGDLDTLSNQSSTEEPQTQDMVGSTKADAESHNTPGGISTTLSVLSADSFTSPFNIRIPPKPKEPYFVLGVNTAMQPPKPQDDGKG
ncbi:hypothetical protein BBO99_00002815 [Phytophthora kernoviae]|uniref:Uncharacterized protein n=2 Tax=Phytophthora kernoviae TaxID=325452 RepID=A0A421EVT8_9STRA|nr:hypothetical protein G195_004458 [Phytophthora kernoviae 00238/432]KAG2526322.1 hypothetical protein JM16_003932 [Phytophthora kernoviae]KAG2527886.1 hypothetical protein JM18_003464 [Phytophthora kernoviae]RLN05808.1 hypothetical protein BBI17_002995 [Phytophthora kernoviae]RLN82543.1 hypothetical protein BBO99_00002815 [Phytophthora kernoviae]